MPKKLTIEYVSNFVKENTDGMCSVLSLEYINDRQPLLIKCKCGNAFERNFAHLRRKQLYCLSCSRDFQSQMFRNDFEKVKMYIESKGCEYISGEYINNKSILTLKCKCGNTFRKRYSKFYTGQDYCNKCGNENLRKAKTKYTVDDVAKEIEPLGYTICDKQQYVNSLSKLDCICPNGHKFKFVYAWYKNGEGCSQCAIEKNRGANSHKFKGGISKSMDCLRDCTNVWRKECKSEFNNCCAITKEKGKRLDVHHLNSFNIIIKRAEEKCGILMQPTLADYETLEDFYTLKRTVMEENSKEIGIPLLRKIHIEFHQVYGNGDNTEKEFDEFLHARYNTSLEKVLAQRKSLERKA